MKEFISIITPAYNSARWIKQTISSVLAQNYTHFEWIIVNDGSNDETQDIIKNIKDSRIILINQKNKGEAEARNTGIRHAKGSLITFIDSDDLWKPTFLSRLSAVFQDPFIKICWCHSILFYDEINYHKPQPWTNIQATGNLWWDTLLDAKLLMGNFIVRKEIIEKTGYFNPYLKVGTDRDFQLRMLEIIYSDSTNKSYLVPLQLFLYRSRANSAVNNVDFTLATEWDMMQKHLEYPGVPDFIRRRGYSFLAFKMATVAFFGKHDLGLALKWYVKAFRKYVSRK